VRTGGGERGRDCKKIEKETFDGKVPWWRCNLPKVGRSQRKVGGQKGWERAWESDRPTKVRIVQLVRILLQVVLVGLRRGKSERETTTPRGEKGGEVRRPKGKSCTTRDWAKTKRFVRTLSSKEGSKGRSTKETRRERGIRSRAKTYIPQSIWRPPFGGTRHGGTPHTQNRQKI